MSHLTQIIEQNLVIWLASDIIKPNKYCRYFIAQLRSIYDDIILFTDVDECIDFLTEINDEKVSMIISENIVEYLIPLIHDISQLNAIYLFDNNTFKYQEWSKIKGIYIEPISLCQAFRQIIGKCDSDSIPMTFIPDNIGLNKKNLDQLEPSFMYTKIFKGFFIAVKHDPRYTQHTINMFYTYCQKKEHGVLPSMIKFKENYCSNLAIYWYTYPSFIYSMLNTALRTLDVDTIMKMGFFIHDLHHQIEELHTQQFVDQYKPSFTVYRGQRLPKKDFEKLLEMKNGLISFNNFLSTSTDQELSIIFAMNSVTTDNSIGILFNITINPSISSSPYANIADYSYFKNEQEILFSMHTIFRIGEIVEIEMENPESIYEVKLYITEDDDRRLRILSNYIEENAGLTWFDRLIYVLIALKHFDQAEKLCTTKLNQSSDDNSLSYYYNQLGCIMIQKKTFQEAIQFLHKSLELKKKRSFQPKRSDASLSESYNNLGVVYKEMGQYSEALSFYGKSLELKDKVKQQDRPSIANLYCNIGSLHNSMKDYSQAISFYEKALDIQKEVLPQNHPDLATTYNNIGSVYDNKAEYSKALECYQKSLDIKENSLPSNHPSLINAYNNIYLVYKNKREYSNACLFYKKILEIRENTLSPTDLKLAISYNDYGLICDKLGEYSEALLFYKKSLEINEKVQPENYRSLSVLYYNIGSVYNKLGDYPNAALFYEKKLEISRKTLPSNHPDLATEYKDVGSIYERMKKYSEAISYFEKSFEIKQKILPGNDPALADMCTTMGSAYDDVGDYSNTLLYYEKAFEIKKNILPKNDHILESLKFIINYMYKKLGKHSEASAIE